MTGAQVALLPDGRLVIVVDPEPALVLAGLAHRMARRDGLTVRQDVRALVDDIVNTAAMSTAGHGLSVDMSPSGHGNADPATVGGQWRDEITVEEAATMLHPLTARHIRRIAEAELGGRKPGGRWLVDRNLCAARAKRAG